jgi:hypothetical protein
MDIPKDTRCLYYHAEKCQSQKHCRFSQIVNRAKTCKLGGNIGKMEIKRNIDLIP